MNEFKKLEYKRKLIFKQPSQDLDLCCDSFLHYSEKCFTLVYRALYEGHQHGGRKVTETSVIEFCRRNKKLFCHFYHFITFCSLLALIVTAFNAGMIFCDVTIWHCVTSKRKQNVTLRTNYE